MNSGEGMREDPAPAERAAGWPAVLCEMALGTRAAVARFPAATLFLLLAAAAANLQVAGVELSRLAEPQDLMPALMAGALAACSTRLACERLRGAAWLAHLVSLGVGLAAFAVLWPAFFAHTVKWAFLGGLVGLLPLAPFLLRGDSASFWLFGVRLAFAAVLAAGVLVLLGGGLSAICASLRYLFGLPVPDELYGHVWSTVGLAVAPLFGLGQIPHDFDSRPGDLEAGFMNRGMRALGDFAAAPLLLAYAVILHLYALKILATGSVPKGQIGWLVLTYGLSVFGTLILCRPFLDRARAPTRLFMRLWPLLLPVPLTLLFYALALRIADFGLTPDRFLLGLFGLVAIILVFVQALPRWRGDTRLILGLPVAALLAGSFGPQGAAARSVASQSARFLDIVRRPPVDEERHEQAISALRFLESHDGLARVAPEGGDPDAAVPDRFRAVALGWGLDPDRVHRRDRELILQVTAEEPQAIAVDGYDVVVQNLHLYADGSHGRGLRLPGDARLSMTLDGQALAVSGGAEGGAARFPIGGASLDALAGQASGGPYVLELEAGGRRIKLVATFVHLQLQPTRQLRGFNGAVLLRSGDWR